MTITMIADDDLPDREWFAPLTPVSGRHRRPGLDIEQVPVDEPVQWPTDEPSADEPVDQADELVDQAPVDELVDVEPAELDPLADKQVGDSFAAVPVNQPVCGALNEQAFAGDQTYACGRRPHPAHWQHLGVWQDRVQQIWIDSPDPFGHVRVGDDDPERDVVLGELCGAPGPTEFDLLGVTVRNSCTRSPHPRNWQHIAVDDVEVTEVWPDSETPTMDAPSTPADLVDAIDTLVDGALDAVNHRRIDAVDEPFNERMEHVARTVLAAARVRTGLLDDPRRQAIAAVLVAYGNVTDTATSLPTPLLVALERAVAVLGEPVAPVDQVAGVLDVAQSAGA